MFLEGCHAFPMVTPCLLYTSDFAFIDSTTVFDDRLTVRPVFREPFLLLSPPDSRYPDEVDPAALDVEEELLVTWDPDFIRWHDRWFGSGAMCIRDRGKDGVAGVGQSGEDAQPDARPRGGHIAAQHAADHDAAQQGHHEGDELAGGEGRFPQKRAEEHHEGGRKIQEHRRHRQGAHGLALEVHKAQSQYADQSGAEEDGLSLIHI